MVLFHISFRLLVALGVILVYAPTRRLESCLKSNASVDTRSPSYTTAPNSQLTGPDGGVKNPLIPMKIGGSPPLITAEPSKTVRFLGCRLEFAYAITIVQPPQPLFIPTGPTTFASQYVPFGFMVFTREVMSAKHR